MGNWTTSNWSNLIIETNLNEIFVQGTAKEKPVYPKLYKVETTDKWEKKDITIPNMPLYTTGREGTNIVTVDNAQKYVTTYTQQRYESGFVCTYELGKFDMYDVIDTFGKRMLDAAQATIGYYAADRFNNQTSTATGYAMDGDGKALVASDHTLFYGGTASNNAGAVDLTIANLETALYHYEVLKDDRSSPRAAKTPKYLLVHPSDRQLAVKCLKSVNVPFEQTNTYNALRDYQLELVVDKWLSDTDAWGLFPADIEYNKCLKAQNPDVEVTYEGRTRNKLVTSLMFFRFSFSDWRDVYMGQGG